MRRCIYSCANQGRLGYAAVTNQSSNLSVLTRHKFFYFLLLQSVMEPVYALLHLETQGSRLSEILSSQHIRFSRSLKQGKKLRGM